MPVVTRSQALAAVRNRRNIPVRKYTFVIQEKEVDYESDYEPIDDEDIESEYDPNSDTETETVDSDGETENDDETASVVSLDSDNGKTIQKRIDYLRAELALAEARLKKLETEQESQMTDNIDMWIRMITALTVTWGVYTWLSWSVVPSKETRW